MERERAKEKEPKPIKIINSVAPIRICDLGGWTDTWFAEHGQVFNIGVYPYVEVQVEVFPEKVLGNRIVLNAENYSDRYEVSRENTQGWIKHPLLEAAINFMKVPKNLSLQITIFSETPAGCSTGTSASVTVALIGALSQLSSDRLTPAEAAYAAQKIETEILHQQCGIQDQLCAAFGGINFIDMTNYPYATVSPIHIPDSLWWSLEQRLCLIYLGKPHISSEIHEMVIADLENLGPENEKIANLRKTPRLARNAIYQGDFEALGKAMRQNNEYQRALHPKLICEEADQIFSAAKEYGALGWKVNGAGGQGGSVTILASHSMTIKRQMLNEIVKINPLFRNIPIYLSRFGLRIWEYKTESPIPPES